MPSTRRTSGTRQRRAQVSAKLELLAQAAVVGAAAHGEVVAGDEHIAAVDAGAAAHHVGRREADEIALRVVLGKAGDGADLLEGALIDEPGDALAHGELARGLVAGDLVGAAQRQGEPAPALHFVELGLPAHARVRLRASAAPGPRRPWLFSSTSHLATRPARSALTGMCIFMASTMATSVSAATVSPSCTRRVISCPATGDVTL